MVSRMTAGIGEVAAEGLSHMRVTIVLVSRNPDQCAATAANICSETGNQLVDYLASSMDIEHIIGKYFSKQKVIPSDPATYDMAAAQRFWDISAQMVGLQEG